MKSSIIWLEDVRECDADNVGGKATNLAFISARGISVPAAFCVTAEAFRRSVRTSATSEGQRETEQRRPAPEVIEAPDEIRKDILSAYHTLLGRCGSDTAVAVRSSATTEDSPRASFAGQFGTRLNVRGEHELIRSVADCWASLFAPRVSAYAERHNLSPDSISTAVIVQMMIEPSVSGVMFTCNPVTGDRSQAVIEAAWGAGEAVASGVVTPDTYVLDKCSLAVVQKSVGAKGLMIALSTGGSGTRLVETPERVRDRECLTPNQLRALAEAGARIESFYSRPQDIEWAIDQEGLLHILQSRPVTTG